MKKLFFSFIALAAISCTKVITEAKPVAKLPEQLAQPCKCPDTLITPQGNKMLICRDTVVPAVISDLKR